MNPENTKKLFEKYPKLFPEEERKNPRRSLMGPGFGVKDGWFNLIDELCADIQNTIDMEKKKNPEYEQVRVVQVKEKIGGLRFYTDGSDEKTSDMIHKAERESYRICEFCGKKGKLTTLYHWYKTLCESCKKKGRRK
jgi:hypothetical protein